MLCTNYAKLSARLRRKQNAHRLFYGDAIKSIEMKIADWDGSLVSCERFKINNTLVESHPPPGRCLPSSCILHVRENPFVACRNNFRSDGMTSGALLYSKLGTHSLRRRFKTLTRSHVEICFAETGGNSSQRTSDTFPTLSG